MEQLEDTSKLAFEDIKPELQEREYEVLKALNTIQPANNMMISKYSGMSLSSVCGRMNTLRNKKKLVTFAFQCQCPFTHKQTKFWKLAKQ